MVLRVLWLGGRDFVSVLLVFRIQEVPVLIYLTWWASELTLMHSWYQGHFKNGFRVVVCYLKTGGQVELSSWDGRMNNWFQYSVKTWGPLRPFYRKTSHKLQWKGTTGEWCFRLVSEIKRKAEKMAQQLTVFLYSLEEFQKWGVPLFNGSHVRYILGKLWNVRDRIKEHPPKKDSEMAGEWK